jgi:hypothetical protein
MALDNVAVIAGTFSPAALELAFDTVVARASGPAPEFYEMAAGALAPGGCAILYSNPSQRLDLAGAQRAGLGAYRSNRYTVRRAGGTVERMLAVWQKTKKAP